MFSSKLHSCTRRFALCSRPGSICIATDPQLTSVRGRPGQGPPPSPALGAPGPAAGPASSCRRSGSSRSSSSAAVSAPSAQPGQLDSATSEMASLRTEVYDLFKAAVASAYPELAAAGEGDPNVAACADPRNGEYQCNSAMQLFARLKGKPGAPNSPRDVGSALVAALPANTVLEHTEVAGPGFINCRISRPHLAARVSRMLSEGVATWAPTRGLEGKKVVVDFSSPNVAKEMHVGHLRSTILGDTLCRTLEFCGADVLRLNHIGDWGTQFGMLIEYMSEMRPEGLGEEGGKEEDVADLMQLYRSAKKRFDEDPDFKLRAQKAVTQLQSGNAIFLAAWKRICDASRKEFQALYDRLGVTITERGESFYNPKLQSVVSELQESGVAELSEGAICVFVEGVKIPLIVQKTDGGFGYASTDMAAIKQRITEEKADWIIYVTDSGQGTHFDMIFAAARKAGWLPAKGPKGSPPPHPKVDHVGFGLVMGEDGKKFKTRSGDTVRLVELLDEAKLRCAESLRSRAEERGEAVDEAELEAASKAMGYGAVKYADLKNNRLTNYRFSFDAMLDLKGNTAVYLLYAHARIAGILRKSNRDVAELARGSDWQSITLTHKREEELALHLLKFPETIEDLLSDLMPNRLTEYLYELSNKFSNFYTDCKVLGTEEETSRLLLVEAVAVVMRQCFSLLGITPLYRI